MKWSKFKEMSYCGVVFSNDPKSFFKIIAFLFLSACAEPVTFSEPQPVGSKNLSQFPNRLQGIYISSDDSTQLIINETVVKRICDLEFILHENELDSASKISGDTIIDLNSNKKYQFKRIGDSLLIRVNYMDTLFRIGQQNYLRKFKNIYFMNGFKENMGWQVTKIELIKKALITGSITQTDLDSLSSISNAVKDTSVLNSLALSKKQFKQFVRKGGFSEEEVFIKQ